MRSQPFSFWLATRHLLCSVALPFSSWVSAENTIAVYCDVTYAGHTQRIAVEPTLEPYAAKTHDIGGRFRFKSIYVTDAQRTPRLGLYVYFETAPQAILIQQVNLEVPKASNLHKDTANLLGEQHLYSGPLERELIYACFATKDK